MPAKHILKNGGYEADLLVDDTVSNEAGHDAFRLVGSDNTLINPRCNDLRCRISAHCDYIQEYPEGLEPNAQFMGAIAYNNIVDGGELNANGSMQGYFFGDGGKVGGVVKNLVIQTEATHEFSIYGALHDNTFENIKDKDGNLITLFFDDMRIGGGHPLAFFVSSFKDHSYEPINTNNPIDDRRGTKWQKNKKYVDNFDLYLWREISEHFRHEYADAPKEQRFDIHFRKVLAEYERVTAKDTIKIAIIPGHNDRSRGKIRYGTSEFQFAQNFIDQLLPLVEHIPGIEVRVFERKYHGSYAKEIRELFSRVDSWGATISMELHYNAHAGTAKGHEVLHYIKSRGGALVASVLDEGFDKYLDNPDRNRKAVPVGGRGSYGLSYGKPYSIISEPFFSKELPEFMQDGKQRQNLLDAYIYFFENIGERL